MAEFLEISFPLKISLGAMGGPERRTQIVTSASGHEERNQQWANSRRSWDVSTGIRDIAEAEQVAAFFEDVRGRLSGFRFCDPLDLKSCAVLSSHTELDQTIGTGDGSQTQFQIVKKYGTTNPYYRKIVKPKTGTVLIGVDGSVVNPADYTVDNTTGIVTFDVAPAVGLVVTAGYKFEVPVRFDTDKLDLVWENHELISVPSIPILELLL